MVGGGSAPTITNSNWQCASLNGITYFFQSGHNPLIYDPAVSTTTYRRVSEKSGYHATVPDANIVFQRLVDCGRQIQQAIMQLFTSVT
jgi:hypothetical protein